MSSEKMCAEKRVTGVRGLYVLVGFYLAADAGCLFCYSVSVSGFELLAEDPLPLDMLDMLAVGQPTTGRSRRQPAFARETNPNEIVNALSRVDRKRRVKNAWNYEFPLANRPLDVD
ncbi:hypothetical protein KQX54_010175 [Cotesia glomerata]|uniref:Uncharacterized protein n=1 Tax=Cotesia glomerata TaxID=32391 RepID=A0AAV7IGI8_COTGL|nr:hypothetical protein KQX54_010175 [Cotesia glomerata]